MGKSFLISLALLLFSFIAFAGAKDGGGGDPLAVEFLQLAEKVRGLVAHHQIPGVHVTTAQVDAEIKKIEDSLEGLRPILTFPPGETLQCDQAPKIGCVNPDDSIRIARDGWNNLTQQEKLETAALEILLASGEPDRYQLVAEISSGLLPKTLFVPPLTHYYRASNACDGIIGDGWTGAQQGETVRVAGEFSCNGFHYYKVIRPNGRPQFVDMNDVGTGS